MNIQTFFNKNILQSGISVLLCVAIGMSMILPGTDMIQLHPENPMVQSETLQEISALNLGEVAGDITNIVMPTGNGTSQNASGLSGGGEQLEGEEQQDLPQEEIPPEEMEPEEAEETEAMASEPEQAQTGEEPDPGTDGNNLDEGSEDEGNQIGAEGEAGSEEVELDLTVGMNWYKYGTDPVTLVCAPGGTVAQSVNTAQLTDDTLKYDFYINGSDAGYADITEVLVAAGDGVFREISENGSVDIELPDGGLYREYTFRVTAVMDKPDKEGEVTSQELDFTYVLKLEETLDLEMELIWHPGEGSDRSIVCGADKTEYFTVTNTDLTERVFGYSVQLTGSMANYAEIVSAQYTTASGEKTGNLSMDSGTLILDPAPGTDEETYHLLFTVKTAERQVMYQYKLQYRETLDAQMAFHWMEKGSVRRTNVCEPGQRTLIRVKNNQLSAGAIPYELELTGEDGAEGRILSVSYTADGGESGNLESSGSLAMRMPEGASSNTYRIAVSAMVKGQRVNYEFEISYSADVSLQMEYTVMEDGAEVTRQIICENTRSKTAEAIYDDQLTEGVLSYTMSVIGEDSQVGISSVTCYQSGSGRSVTVSEQGEIVLLLKDGKTGENTFQIKAEDGSGSTYHFTVNIPYKHRGENNIKIQVNLIDGQEIINETNTNLTVQAWSEDAGGSVVSYIPANGTDTRLVVRFDDEILQYVSSAGMVSEYNLYPANPEVGDTNTHTLYIYAEDAFGNFGELMLNLQGKRQEEGQVIGKASIYVDMTALGLGVAASLDYDVLANEPISYVVAKAIMGEDLGEPFGSAKETLGWTGSYLGTLDIGFYLQSLTTGLNANALEDGRWPGSSEEEVLQAIDQRFGPGSSLASLWRCIYRNGFSKSTGSGNSFGEFDYTNGSGWLYNIGGDTYYPGQSMSDIYLQDGDVLTLRYTLAYGWDVGAGVNEQGNLVGYCVSALNGSITVNHRMETVENEDGSLSAACRCCGLTESCAHNNKIWMELEDVGMHIQFCEDCKKELGDAKSHVWVCKEAAADDENGEHVCEECGASEGHEWVELEGTNTADCTQSGVRSTQCSECRYIREEEIPAKGHITEAVWNVTAEVHYEKCSVCQEIINEGTHEYEHSVYVEGGAEVDDFECRICHAYHSDFCSSVLSEISVTCQKCIFYCDHCGYTLEMTGEFEEYHSYISGSCEYCQEADPDAGEPEPEEPEPEPEEPEPEPEEPEPEPEEPEPEPEEPEPDPEEPEPDPEESDAETE